MNELTPEERERTPAYIVTCPVCNGMIGAHVDDGNHRAETAAFVAEHISLGYPVERRTVADARVAVWCNCEIEEESND
ncbi:MAG: hypothetical protein KDD75_03875 [Caldilineaceae bacterium]|nr:hypothetical protein [Caldilinea sp.]MCB0134229.1 hypothetical protein [Caldilineaceae bacterium]